MNCPSCHRAIPFTINYCTYCGAMTFFLRAVIGIAAVCIALSAVYVVWTESSGIPAALTPAATPAPPVAVLAAAPTQEPQPTATPAPEPEPSLLPTATATIAPTPTDTPTLTPTATPTPQPTYTPYPTPRQRSGPQQHLHPGRRGSRGCYGKLNMLTRNIPYQCQASGQEVV